MATKRKVTNLTEYKVAFNGMAFPVNTTVCIPSDWSDEVVTALGGKLLKLEISSEDEAQPQAVSATPVDPPTEATESTEPTDAFGWPRR